MANKKSKKQKNNSEVENLKPDVLTDMVAELNASPDLDFLEMIDSAAPQASQDFTNQESVEDHLEALSLESVQDINVLDQDSMENQEDPLREFLGQTTEDESLEPSEELLAEEAEQAVEQQYLTDDEALSVIESLLFISERPMGLTTLKAAFENTNVNTKKLKELLNELKVDFVNARRGVTLEEIDGAYQIRTKADNQDFIKKILKPKIFKLTGPSLETLAIVAYKQPCVKSQVDEIRGVESGHLIRALMDKGLVAFDGKSELPGRPMQYKTTRKFLEIFGLRNISELPSLSEIEELLPDGIGDDEEKQTLSDLAGKIEENFEAQSYSVGEEELGQITEQLSEISTETEFFEVEKQRQREARDRDRAESIKEAVILGDPVDPKDLKWLERYEAKLNVSSTETLSSVDELQNESEDALTDFDVDEDMQMQKDSESSEDIEEERSELDELIKESTKDPLDLI